MANNIPSLAGHVLDALNTNGRCQAGPEPSQPTLQASPGQQRNTKATESILAKIKANLTALGFTTKLVLLMIKGSLPPTIALALYQSPAVSAFYQRLGYLVAIASILNLCIMPRGKFIQTLSLNILAVCIAAAVNLLAFYCATQARQHTSAPSQHTSANATTTTAAAAAAADADAPITTLVPYNSSASVVCAVFLVMQLYVVNVLRARMPSLRLPAIVYSAIACVALTNGVLVPTMDAARGFLRSVLVVFLSGFAIATAVHFAFVPTTSRQAALRGMAGYAKLLGGILKAQTAYVRSVKDMDGALQGRQCAEETHSSPPRRTLVTPASVKVQELLAKIRRLHAKLGEDVMLAKREFAWGVLGPKDIGELWRLLRMAFLPVVGIGAVMDQLQDFFGDDADASAQDQFAQDLRMVAAPLHKSFAGMSRDAQLALQHAQLIFRLDQSPSRKKQQDEESRGAEQRPAPGSAGFAEWYCKRAQIFAQTRQKTLQAWSEESGIAIPTGFIDSILQRPGSDTTSQRESLQPLAFALAMEYMLCRASASLEELVMYAETRRLQLQLSKHRVIFPGLHTLNKWLQEIQGADGATTAAGSETIGERDSCGGISQAPYLCQDFGRPKDPEHLPPRNRRERVGDVIRTLPALFRTRESAYSLRVVLATMTIAVFCYLRDSQRFFIEQRLVWAIMMVTISMARTAGQSTYMFALRLVGAAVSAVGALVIWYGAADGHAAGVIPLLFLFLTVCVYFAVKMRDQIVVSILSMVAVVAVVGYELQLQILGTTSAEETGRRAYPMKILAPYRMGTAVGGLFAAYLWTNFPFPVSDGSELRWDLSNGMYLAAQLYAMVHETVQARISGTDGDASVKDTHAYHLAKARIRSFTRLVRLIRKMRASAAFAKSELEIGGRFPRKDYERSVIVLFIPIYLTGSFRSLLQS